MRFRFKKDLPPPRQMMVQSINLIFTKSTKPDLQWKGFSFLSGCRESNPDYMTPSHAYYHYTTARFTYIKVSSNKCVVKTNLTLYPCLPPA